MQAIIIGGGLGGLALGSGLARSGWDVSVVERDRDLAATGGYHITLQQPVQEALAEILPPRVFEMILASAADGRRRDPDVLWDPRGRHIGALPLKGADPGIDIDRITLRLLLAEAVGDRLVFGRAFERFERKEDGRITAVLADGDRIEADVLVGADGVHSTVATALAGDRTHGPAGITGVSGRTAVAALPASVRTRLGTRSSLAIGPGATALYYGYLDPVGHAVLDEPDLRRSVTTEPTFIWGAMFADSEFTRSLRGRDGLGIRDAVLGRLAERGWTSATTDPVRLTDPSSVGVFRFHSASEKAREQAPWPAGPVTALGDAVHATPPTAGMGAGAAIRDAAALTRALAPVLAGERSIPLAVRQFEAGMRERGAEVVQAAMTTVRWILATGTPVGSIATRLALPALAGVTAMRAGRR